MSDYLAGYGVTDSRRETRFKWVVGIVLGSIVLGVTGWYNLRTWSEERLVKQFFESLAQKNYKEAHRLFGCSDEAPCRDYQMDKFLRDWGAESPYADVSNVKITLAEPCGNTVWVSIKHPKQDELGLAIDPETKSIGFAPEARCPGVWRLREFPARVAAYWKKQSAEPPPPPPPGR